MHFNKQVPLIIGTNKNEGLLIKVNHHLLHFIFVFTIFNFIETMNFNAAFHESMFQGFLQRDGGDKFDFDFEVLNI